MRCYPILNQDLAVRSLFSSKDTGLEAQTEQCLRFVQRSVQEITNLARPLDDVIRRLGIAEAMSERAIEAVAFRLIDEIRFSAKLGSQNRAPLS